VGWGERVAGLGFWEAEVNFLGVDRPFENSHLWQIQPDVGPPGVAC